MTFQGLQIVIMKLKKKLNSQSENFRELRISVEKIKNRADRVKKMEFSKSKLIDQ